jgi:ABC-type transport system involved in multi-copper enzyme maturation permease subunit
MAGARFRLYAPSTIQLLWALGVLTGTSLLALLLAVLTAGNKVSRVWQEPPPSKFRKWFELTFCTPIFWLSFFRAMMLRQIERNPVGWLERRTWSGRLVTWGWFAVVISIYVAALHERQFLRGLGGFQNIVAWLLAGSLAVSSAGSFRRERETGVLELLLISPLAEGDIISGRLRGLWGQFLPAFGTLFFLWLYLSSFISETYYAAPILFHICTFATLPIVGLYYSLRCRNFLAAFLMTFLVGLLLPVVLGILLYNSSTDESLLGQSMGAAFFQCVLAFLCGNALYHRLKERQFSFTSESRA